MSLFYRQPSKIDTCTSKCSTYCNTENYMNTNNNMINANFVCLNVIKTSTKKLRSCLVKSVGEGGFITLNRLTLLRNTQSSLVHRND